MKCEKCFKQIKGPVYWNMFCQDCALYSAEKDYVREQVEHHQGKNHLNKIYMQKLKKQVRNLHETIYRNRVHKD